MFTVFSVRVLCSPTCYKQITLLSQVPPANQPSEEDNNPDTPDRDAQYLTSILPLGGSPYCSFVASSIERASINSERSDVSTDCEIDAMVPTVHHGSHLLQDSDDDHLLSQSLNADGAVSPTSLSANASSHADETRASFEMQDLYKPYALKPNLPPTSLLQLMYIWRWEVSTWFLGTVGYLSNFVHAGVADGTLQEDWHFRIQITAFVAALAQLSQSALLVPTASSIA